MASSDDTVARLEALEAEVRKLREALRRMGESRTNYHYALLTQTQPGLFVVEADRAAWKARCELETARLMQEMLA